MSKKRLGSPPKPLERVKSRYLQVRVEEVEKQGFDQAAQLAGLPLSGWVRERLRMAARTELEEMNKVLPFLT